MFNMKTLFTLAVVALVTTVFIAPPAEAKRLGGGMSFGKSYKYSRPVQRQATPAQSARKPASAQQAAGSAGRTSRGGMMGMLGGLAAGGLLGALLFGGAFENINFFDILLLGGLAFGGMALFRAMRRNASPARPREAAAGPAGYQPPPAPEAQTRQSAGSGFQVPEIGSALQGEKLAEKPDWFDEHAFMAEAENHFMTLQKAWDSGDMSSIKEYVTPEFLAFISKERAALPAQQETKIIDLQSRLLDLLRDGDKVVAAILFQGYEQEPGRDPEAFADIWHVEHPADDPNADWLLAGIRKLDEVDG